MHEKTLKKVTSLANEIKKNNKYFPLLFWHDNIRYAKRFVQINKKKKQNTIFIAFIMQ